MKKAIKLVLIDLFCIQVVAPFLMLIPYSIYLWVTTGTWDESALMERIMIPAQLTGLFLVGLYLWMGGHICVQRRSWSPISFSFLLFSGIAMLLAGVLVSAIMLPLDWIPNIMEQSFDILQSGWGGIAAIAFVGPLVEELLFRGAILSSLQQQYTTSQSILLSAFLFGVSHLNPAQMLPAFLLGILLAWTRCQTGSLLPCVFMHVLNNSLAVYLSIQFPEVENVNELASSDSFHPLFLAWVLLLFAFMLWRMYRISSFYKNQLLEGEK